MSYIDVTGKTEDEAIRKALEQLHMDRDDVSVEILERAKSGFLGIGSPRPGSRSLLRLPSRLLSLPRLPRPPLPPRSSLSWTTTPGALPSS